VNLVIEVVKGYGEIDGKYSSGPRAQGRMRD